MNTRTFEHLSSQQRCADGAMHTELSKMGLLPNEFAMSWLLKHPHKIAQVHQSYHNAGASVISTHSFSGSKTSLAQHRHDTQAFELNRIAAIIARAIATPHHFVLGTIGPCHHPNHHVQSPQSLTPDPYIPQIAGLYAGGADAILIETLTHPNEIQLIQRANRELPHPLPIIASFVFKKSSTSSYRNLLNTQASETIQQACDLGINAIGINCGVNLTYSDYLRLAEITMKNCQNLPVMVQPNGNLIPSRTDDLREFADLAQSLFAIGVRIVGGCCGSDPSHIKKIAQALPGRPQG